jgi:AmpD protein
MLSKGLAIEKGVLPAARQLPSPNFDERPKDKSINLLVIHCISLPPAEYGGDAIERFFLNDLDSTEHPYYESIADLKVSAHLLIKRTGEVLQFVNFANRAWHAGVSCFEGVEACNDNSIGIELEGIDTDTYEAIQYEVLADIILAIQQAYPAITADRIVGHEHVAPDRKKDPGQKFDWDHLKALLA